MKLLNNMENYQKIKNISPITLLSLGYLVIILLSAGILTLPVSSTTGVYTSYLDSVFTATSAITTTGLIVFDTGTYYTLFGQTIIMLLIQVGGLGYMLFVILIFIAFNQKISLQSNLMLQESIKRPLRVDVFYFAKIIIVFTIVIEILGAVFLAFIFYQSSHLGRSIYSGVFHSISAFNTAGFSIYQDSFCKFVNHIPLHIILIIVSTLGSLGFFVLYEISKIFSEKLKGLKNKRLSVHSRIVLLCTVILVISGSILLFFTENWGDGVSVQQKVLSSLFQVSTASTTTGFNSIDIGKMQASNLFLLIIMMFIGAGSGGTAGGVKMTTFMVTILSTYAIIRDRSTVNIFKRRLTFEIIRNSLAIVILTIAWITLATYILSITEKKGFIDLLFEVTSAIGTVGLSTGITAGLSAAGKMVIIISMFIGRVGALGIGISLLKSMKEPSYKYSTTDIFIG